jgi:alpha-N-arabinofuranosidase
MNVLPVAQCLNSFIRHADVVRMANFTLLTSLLSNDPVKGTFRSPLFYTFKLFSNNCLGKSVDTYVDCDTFNTVKYTGVPYLDVTTVYSADNKEVFINVVNRHQEKPIDARVVSTSGVFSGKAEINVINVADLKAPFEFDKRELYKPVTTLASVSGNKLKFSFSPHSFTQIKVHVEN